MYQEAIKLIKENSTSAQSLSFLGYLVKKAGSNSDKATFLATLKKMSFSKYDYLYEEFCNYISLALRNENSYQLYSFLKQKVLIKLSILFNKTLFCVYFTMFLHDICNLLYEMHSYKNNQLQKFTKFLKKVKKSVDTNF